MSSAESFSLSNFRIGPFISGTTHTILRLGQRPVVGRPACIDKSPFKLSSALLRPCQDLLPHPGCILTEVCMQKVVYCILICNCVYRLQSMEQMMIAEQIGRKGQLG